VFLLLRFSSKKRRPHLHQLQPLLSVDRAQDTRQNETRRLQNMDRRRAHVYVLSFSILRNIRVLTISSWYHI